MPMPFEWPPANPKRKEYISEMSKAIRIAVAVFLTLVVFCGLMYLFIYKVFRVNYGYVRSDVVILVAIVVFICSAFVVNVSWQAACSRFSK
jgi:hypothetical protein